MRPEKVDRKEECKSKNLYGTEELRKAVLYAIYRFGVQNLQITTDSLTYVLQNAGYEITINHIQAYLANFARETLGEFDGEEFIPVEDFEQLIEDHGWKDLPQNKRKDITMSQVELGKIDDIETALDQWKADELTQFLGVTSDAVITNAVRLKINLPELGNLIRFDLTPALESKYQPTVDSARRKILDDLQADLNLPVAHISTSADIATAYIPGDISEDTNLRFYNVRLKYTINPIPSDRLGPDVYSSIGEWVLHSGLRALGYHQRRGKKEFYTIDNPEKCAWGSRTLSRFPGFHIEPFRCEVDGDNNVMVTFWVDPVSRDGFLLEDLDSEQVGGKYKDTMVRLMPGGWSARIVEPGPKDMNLASYQGPDDKQPILERFNRFYGAMITRQRDNIIMVHRGEFGPKRPETWPQSLVLVSTHDPRFDSENRKNYPPATMEPGARLREVEWFIHNISQAAEFELTLFDAKVEGPLPLGNIGSHQLTTDRAVRPSFRFSNNRLGNSTLKIYRWGPNSKPKRIRVVGVFIPDNLDIPIDGILRKVRTSFIKCHFGELLIDSAPILRYTSTPDPSDLVRLAEGRSANRSDEVPIFIGILDGRTAELRVMLKEASHIAASAPCQCVGASTLSAIQSDARGVAKGFALQLYLKGLQPGEALWTVEPPVDNTGETAFVGVGYSSDPSNLEKRANSFAALSDPIGTHAHWQGVGTIGSRDKYMTPDAVQSLHRFVLKAIANKPFKRVVIYRKGDFYPEEKTAILAAFGEAFRKSYRLDFVSVKDTSARFVVQLGLSTKPSSNIRNVPPGFFVCLDDSRALLSSSYPEERTDTQGTTRLVLLTRELGETPITQIVQEYRAQTFLCWESPANPGKSPLVLHLCDELAGLMRYARDTGVCNYFPG